MNHKVRPIHPHTPGSEEKPSALNLQHPTVDHLLVGYSSRALGEGATLNAIADLSNRIARQHEKARRDLGEIEPTDVSQLSEELAFFSI